MNYRYLFYAFLLSLIIIASCSTESKPVYQLTTAAEPIEAGSVTPATAEAKEGATIQVEANANEHWVFDRWGGDHSGNGNPVTIVMSSDMRVTALFIKKDYSLTVNVEGGGAVEERVVQQKSTDYEHETIVELIATAEEGWLFSGWTGDIVSSENPVTIEMDGEKTVTAVFERRDYALTVNVEGEGAVSEQIVQAKSTDYPFETIVELTANPSTGWVFSHWEGDLTGEENPTQIEIDDAKEVTAVFERGYFEVSYTYEGEGMVNESLQTGNVDDNGLYQFESTVELKAEAADGWKFVSWDGDLLGEENPETITIDSDKEVTAIFERRDYDLTIHIQGEGTVDEEIVQAKTTSYAFETLVELTANPSAGWIFSRWEGDLTGEKNPAQIEIDEAKEVTAVFERDFFEVTVDIEGEGTAEAALVSGNQTDDGFEFGSEVEIIAIANNGWHFSAWTGDVSNSENPITIQIDGDVNITALFERNEYTLTVTTEGEGTVSETLLEGTVTDNGYLFESEVELEAVPSNGWEFSEWREDVTGTENPSKIIIDQNKSVTAVFERIEYLISTEVEGEGDITISPDQQVYFYGDQVVFEAIAEETYLFIQWTGTFNSTENPYTTEISEDVDIKAVFRTVEESLLYRFSGGTFINGRVHGATLSLTNRLPEEIILTKFVLLNASGQELTRAEDNIEISTNNSVSYSISFGIQPTEQTFSEYQTEWHIEYQGETYVKVNDVGFRGGTAKINESNFKIFKLSVD